MRLIREHPEEYEELGDNFFDRYIEEAETLDERCRDAAPAHQQWRAWVKERFHDVEP